MSVAKLLACGLGIAVLAAGTAGAAAGPVYRTPQAYYLALGDSLAYGIQPDKVDAGLPPFGFDTGYVDVFAARLRALAPKIRVVNYGCPGESTLTFVAGGCPWLAGGKKLHDAFKGSQQRAALAFLATHRGRVSPITLTLAGNDVAALSDACKDDLACVQARAPKALAAFADRLSSILGRLRAAAPTAEIIVTGAWNENVDALAATDPLYRALNAAVAKAAAGAKARFADMAPIFNPAGGVAREKARVCALTFVCSRDDAHPTNAGYKAMAGAVLTASGYPTR